MTFFQKFHNCKSLLWPIYGFLAVQVFILIFIITGIDIRIPTVKNTETKCIVIDEVELIHTPSGGGRYSGSTKVYIWSNGIRYKSYRGIWKYGEINMLSAGTELTVTYYAKNNEIIAASVEEKTFYTIDDYLADKKIGMIGTIITSAILELLLCGAITFWYFLFAKKDIKRILHKRKKKVKR